MKVESYQYGDPVVRSVRLSREAVLRKLYCPPREGRWLLAIDPDTALIITPPTPVTPPPAPAPAPAA